MTATNHGLFGAVIAISLQKYPAVAIAVAPFSHFLLDAIPHFGMSQGELHSKRFFRILFADATLAVVSTLALAWVWQEIALLLVVCAFMAASPDLMWIYYEYINPKLRKQHLLPRFHSWIQWSQTGHGIIMEAAWFVILFAGLLLSGVA